MNTMNCDKDLREKVEMLVKLLFSFATITFNMKKQASAVAFPRAFRGQPSRQLHVQS